MINRIYEEMFLDTEQSEEKRQMELQIYAIAQRIEVAKEKEERKDLLFDAGKSGQRAGFIQGFKFAVTLMAQCF